MPATLLHHPRIYRRGRLPIPRIHLHKRIRLLTTATTPERLRRRRVHTMTTHTQRALTLLRYRPQLTVFTPLLLRMKPTRTLTRLRQTDLTATIPQRAAYESITLSAFSISCRYYGAGSFILSS